MDADGSLPGGSEGSESSEGSEIGNAGTLHLHDGRHVEVQRLLHVGETFLFYSRTGGPHAQVISRDEVSSWESARIEREGPQP